MSAEQEINLRINLHRQQTYIESLRILKVNKHLYQSSGGILIYSPPPQNFAK